LRARWHSIDWAGSLPAAGRAARSACCASRRCRASACWRGLGRLFARQLLGVDGHGAFAGGRLQWEADFCDAAFMQPAAQLVLASLTQVRACAQGDGHKGHGQSEQGEAVVCDFKKAVDHIGGKGARTCNRIS